ncbi:hypothetical protein PAHAL_2G213800 [Panicum hallii]|uniref:Uncharacterized protein n=1 Tax=Panicum hallii TaxID=206008 RepID=A0A2T8KPU7_9POAL|nr:hypothetical protein PAHAL_2G213800 [Panicum hallii]
MSPSQSQRPSNWPPAARLLHQRRRPAGVRGRPTSLWQKAGHATGEGVGGALVYQAQLILLRGFTEYIELVTIFAVSPFFRFRARPPLISGIAR